MYRYRNIILIILVFLIGSKIKAEVIKPIAVFDFEKTTYQVGQTIVVQDKSYHPKQHMITKREWKVADKVGPTFKSIREYIKQGKNTIYLRVQDKNGCWSEWVSKEVTIVPIKRIQIVNFRSIKQSYKVGEKLQLQIEYSNPNELEIVAQKWKYKNMTTNGSVVSGKPLYMKRAGIYEITLEVQDEYGNWSNQVSCNIKVVENSIRLNQSYLFEKESPGSLIGKHMNKDYYAFDTLETIEFEDKKGTLILSNSPETIPSSGILYQDTISGESRVIVHHSNGTSYNKKLLIVLTAPKTSDVTVKISHQAIEGPSSHILLSGQKALVNYFKNSKTQTITIRKGEKFCLYDSSKVGVWKKNQVISGSIDIDCSLSTKVQVIAMDETSSLEQVKNLIALPRDGHDRGTFSVIERTIIPQIEDMNKPYKLTVGHKEDWLKGIDALTGKVAYNKGNYGLLVRIKMSVKEPVGIILNARGGEYLGAIRWNQDKIVHVPNKGILLNGEVGALVGTVQVKEKDTTIEYMLPNGSSAPILFGLIPKSSWK